MIECKELEGKVIKRATLYQGGDSGHEANFEFTDGTEFNLCMTSGIEAKLTAGEGGEPRVIRNYAEPE